MDKIEELKIKYETLFGSEIGREVLKDILLNGRVGSSSFDSDPYVHAHNSGKQDLAFHIQYMSTPEPTAKAVEVKID